MKSPFKVLAVAVFMSLSLTGILHAEEASQKLKEISEKQDKILQMLEELRTEINVVKIRVSSS